ncbi:carboxylesterase/lipase family protein [Piscinibacter sp. HJYY11]|uniref:carboxylesterase/lipase family protein n=1 Tax=Piscinibacter sp. HJYY11 TaxID=2801333 RepID=UPI00191F714A|nr:carboxylesterase/lipase family protein [Piscinibacter sp. HJYY11]MBL0730562.1 carboxylesterase/lipase family protein [Piscinibacter sp. HJYY11]
MSTGTSTRVRTSLGELQGLRDGGVSAWLGVPYAQPPVDAQRFMPAAPVQAWHGVRDATQFGAACPQKVVGSMKSLGPALSEDCLTLNIWSPAADGKKRPVVVWVHGGAFLLGSARVYTGAHLAAQGDIVVVALNYRLGVLGFVNFGEALGDERIASNLGLRDQVLALRWVRDHIEAFGGDPGRVTLAGESAGSMSVSLLMHSQEARPLFHRAIMQSGALSLIHDRETSLQVAKLYLDHLGVKTLEQLQALPVESLQAAQEAVHRQLPQTIPSAPWYDGALLPASLTEARQAPTPPIPLLAGYNRDEIRFFELWRGVADVFLSRERMQAVLQRQHGDGFAAQVLAAYPESKYGLRRLGTHMSFAMPTLHFAQRHAAQHPTWFYRFDRGHPMLGAMHAIELFYLWDMKGLLPTMLRGGPLWGSRRALAQRLRRHWIRFVREGRPGDEWEPFDARRATLVFDQRDRMVDDPEGRQREVWGAQDSAPGMAGLGGA